MRFSTQPGVSKRPWPLSFINDEVARLYEDWVRVRGRSLLTLSDAVLKCWPHADSHIQSIAFALGAWHIWGRQSFIVAPLLVEALGETSLHRVPANVVRAPYPAIWIEAPLRLHPSTPVFQGLFLISSEVGGDPVFKVSAGGRFPSGTRTLYACAVRCDERNVPSHVFPTELYLAQETFEDSLEATRTVGRAILEETRSPLLANEPERRRIEEMARSVWEFVSNFLLYLSSPDPDLQVILPAGLEKAPKSAKACEIQDRIRKREGEQRLLGYRLTRVTRTPTANTSETPDESRDPIMPHLVRGHWKAQAHGPKQAQRKIIWIAPYRRGGDGMEERLERDYAL